KLFLRGPSGEGLDGGFVGEVTAVNAEPLRECIRRSITPVISPTALGPGGKIHNCNADIAAAQAAIALKAKRLVFMSDVPGLLRDDLAAVQALFQKHVIPSYARFELALSHGSGSYLYDVAGRRYLDLGGGIAVCCLGHAHAEITQALLEQSARLVHVSNLYYTEPQGRLARALVNLLGPGKVFFCNSGAEANEGLFKLARKFGHDEGRYEILSAFHSFHGRTLAGIAATGQEKVKTGFEPMVPGFRQVPYNDLDAVRAAISPATAAVLIEGIQA